jgi:hypothetical protein
LGCAAFFVVLPNVAHSAAAERNSPQQFGSCVKPRCTRCALACFIAIRAKCLLQNYAGPAIFNRKHMLNICFRYGYAPRSISICSVDPHKNGETKGEFFRREGTSERNNSPKSDSTLQKTEKFKSWWGIFK